MGGNSKMRNVRVEVNGYKFASRAEARRYSELIFLRDHGSIKDLQLHPKFSLAILNQEITTYTADFQYSIFDQSFGNWITIVEDVKGRRAGPAYEMFKVKKRLMKALHGIDVQEYP